MLMVISPIAIPRIPAYIIRMNAKTRYRQRLKVQAALVRLMEVLATNGAEAVPADRTTALMAAQVAKFLAIFIGKAGVGLPDEPDLSRFVHLKQSRLKETKARSRRRRNNDDL